MMYTYQTHLEINMAPFMTEAIFFWENRIKFNDCGHSCR